MKKILLTIISILTFLLNLVALEKPPRPNIIFILADDAGIPSIGCYGGAFKTPNIDRLASEGIKFEYCFSAPLCAPSRAMCMFGRYPFRTGVVNNSTGAAARPDKELCIAKLLKQAGYATAVAGKWTQLQYFNTKEDGQRWGWDEFMIWGIPSPEGGRKRYWNPDYNLNGKYIKDNRFGPDILHEFVVDFIKRHRNEPFFVYYPMPLIHGQLERTPDSKDSGANLYEDNIAYMDKLVGKLVAELDALNLREKTLIVFTGDNGCVGRRTVNGRFIDGNKGDLKEGGSRVPLIVNWKGTTPSGKTLRDLIDFTDFFPTFAELAGAKIPDNLVINGRSFALQLLGLPGNPRDWVYVQLGNNAYLRTDKWKLTSSGEFYNMTDAPFREIPVDLSSATPDAKKAYSTLKESLDKILSENKLLLNNHKKAKALNKQQKNTTKGNPKKENKRLLKNKSIVKLDRKLFRQP